MRQTSIRAAAVMAAIYGYFLIFAQFAFVELARQDFVIHPPHPLSPGTAEKLVLGTMAMAGILAGFRVAWKGASPAKIRVALFIAAFAAAVAPIVGGLPLLLAIATLTGIAIGVSTVSAAALLRSWCGLFWVGLGTGIGYACCNLPVVFSATPMHQAWIAAGFAILGAMCVPARSPIAAPQPKAVFPFFSALILFTALVWLDSAAFFIIQHSSELKSGTWNHGHLWQNAVVHLISAILAGVWLKRSGAKMIPATAWVLLAIAAMAVNRSSGREFAIWIYPAAVSLYSTALVAWPGWFSGAVGENSVTWRAAWLYAVAGWFGSANGIGMAQSLKRVPHEFILIAGVFVAGAVLLSNLKRWRIAVAVTWTIVAALWPRNSKETPPTSSLERGKQVYLAEGCIHCHSQYVRPGTIDEEWWGPAKPAATAFSSRPVIIGNRRQGPDLANIGARRSAAWLKQHFIRPQAFSPGTPMPSYAHLFDDGRGADLVAYLQQSGASETSRVMDKSAAWKPAMVAPSPEGKALFSAQCAACHGPAGLGNGVVAKELVKPPANLVNGPFVWSPESPDLALRISRIIKFGLPGTDMPGHETLRDEQILALQEYVMGLRR